MPYTGSMALIVNGLCGAFLSDGSGFVISEKWRYGWSDNVSKWDCAGLINSWTKGNFRERRSWASWGRRSMASFAAVISSCVGVFGSKAALSSSRVRRETCLGEEVVMGLRIRLDGGRVGRRVWMIRRQPGRRRAGRTIVMKLS